MERISKDQQERLVEILNATIERSENLWKSKEQPHAYIIGYLQGAIKIAIEELDK